MGGKMVLYSYWRSSCSWRVRIALAHKNLPFEIRPVNLLQGKQKAEEYLAVNPFGTVPALVTSEGTVLSESLAIMEYLEEAFPEAPKLLPSEPLERAKVRAVCLKIISGIQPIQNLKVLTYVKDNFGGDEQKTAFAKHWITAGFQALERTLEGVSGRYSVGDAVTLADVCLVPQVYNAARFNVDLAAFPVIRRVHDALTALPAFAAAHPDTQPDCPQQH